MSTKLTRREFLQAGLAAMAGNALAPVLGAGPAAAAGPELARPNLVYIIADQLRACSVGCYGNTQIDTPNMDALAAQGALFTNAVSTSPLCSPHRACLVTGRYPHITGVVRNDEILPASETSIAEVMGAGFYRTLYIGKWHLNGPTPDPINDPGWVGPADRQGFVRWIGFNCAHVYYDGKYYVDRDPLVRQIPPEVYEPDFQTDQAIQFITANRSSRFCVFLSFGPPHITQARRYLPPGGDYHFPYDPETLTLRPNVDYPDAGEARQKYADYYGVTSDLDWNVGRVLATLDSLGLTQNTIVVVSSDHGDVLGSQYSRTGRFNAKGYLYAESLDTPFILRYPQRVAPALVTELFTSVDILPTLLGLCGLPVPGGVMGRDFSPRLVWGLPPTDPPWGPVPTSSSVLVGMFQGSWLGVRTAEYSFSCIGPNLTPKLLFHNTIDPYQLVNRVDDPAYQSVRNELLLELNAWLDYVEYP